MFFDWVRTIGFLYLCFGLPAVESKIWNRNVAIFFSLAHDRYHLNKRTAEGRSWCCFCQESQYVYFVNDCNVFAGKLKDHLDYSILILKYRSNLFL